MLEINVGGEIVPIPAQVDRRNVNRDLAFQFEQCKVQFF